MKKSLHVFTLTAVLVVFAMSAMAGPACSAGKSASGDTAATLNAAVTLVNSLREIITHAFFLSLRVERQALMNPCLGAFDHLPEPGTGINRQIADQFEHGQRVKPDGLG